MTTKVDTNENIKITGGSCVVCSSHSTLRCGSCADGPFYCSKEHQKSDWKSTHRFECGSKYLEKIPDSKYGTIYKAKIPIPIGTTILRKKSILTFPRSLDKCELEQSQPIKMYLQAAMASGHPLDPRAIVPCLDCNKIIPYKQIMMISDVGDGCIGPTRLHSCLRCDWPIHGMPCGSAHDEECEILHANKINWKDYSHIQNVFYLIGILRAVLMKKNSNPNYQVLMKMTTSNKFLTLGADRFVMNFILQKCRLSNVITPAELDSLIKIINSNAYTVCHRPNEQAKYAFTIFEGPQTHGRVLPHNCMANCTLIVDRKTYTGTFIASRDIEVGEVLTLNFDSIFEINPLRGSKHRMQILFDIGISCPCPRCTTCDEGGTMYNVIKCTNHAPCNGFMTPIRQTHEDCPYECQICKTRIPHSEVIELQLEVMSGLQVKCITALRRALKTFTLKKLHPNHFLALRGLQDICALAQHLIIEKNQYYKPGSGLLNHSGFVYADQYLKEFKNYLAAYALLTGIPAEKGGPYNLVIIYSCLRLEKIAKSLRGKFLDELDTYEYDLDEINENLNFGYGLCKNDPVSNSAELDTYKTFGNTYIKFLQSVVEPIVATASVTWDSVPQIYKTLFGKN